MNLVNSPKPEYVAGGRPREQRSFKRLLFRAVIGLLLLVGVGLNLQAWVSGQALDVLTGRTGQISGVMLNAAERPLAGATIFVTTAPNEMGQTDANGRFFLSGLPIETQTLIVVYNEIGQEFTINIDADSVTEVGRLKYIASPDK